MDLSGTEIWAFRGPLLDQTLVFFKKFMDQLVSKCQSLSCWKT